MLSRIVCVVGLSAGALLAQDPVTDTLLVNLTTTADGAPRDAAPQIVAQSDGVTWLRDGSLPWLARGASTTLQPLTAPRGMLFPSLDRDPSRLSARLPDGSVLLQASTFDVGPELFRASPDRPVPELVLDIWRGGDSRPYDFVAWRSEVWFVANDGVHGFQVWRSDGTAGGTRIASDLMPGLPEPRGASRVLRATRGALFAYDQRDEVIWAWTDPEADPVRIASRQFWSGYPAFWSALETRAGLVFPDFDPATGFEPWISDGTAAGTRILFDIVPGLGSSSPGGIASDGTHAWFHAETPDHGRELWVTDGTTAGTRQVADLGPGTAHGIPFSPGKGVCFAGGLLFLADDGVHGQEPWFSDGTAAGTVLLGDLVPGPAGSNPLRFASAAGLGWIVAFTPDSGYELWRTDGTAAGTWQVTDVMPGPDSSAVEVLGAMADGIAFAARGPGVGLEVWFTRGGRMEYRQLADLAPEPQDLGSSLSSFEYEGPGREIVRPFADARVTGLRDTTNPLAPELWLSDGSAANTRRLRSLAPALAGAEIQGPASLAGGVVFAASSGDRGELWFSDGTSAGTRRLAGLRAAYGERLLAHTRVYRWLIGDDGTGWRLWRTDGTLEGTRAGVAVLDPVPSLATANSRTVFGSAEFPGSGTEPWACDADGSRPRLLRDVRPGPEGSQAWIAFANDNGCALFADDGVHGLQPWISDGTVAGTQRMLDHDLPAAGYPAVARFGAGLVFAWERQLWFTDCTRAGSRPFVSLDFSPQQLTAAGDAVYCTSAEELWVTDGTASGTRRLLAAPGGTSQPFALGSGREVAFSAEHPLYGQELWVSDGTMAGTRVVADSRPGRLGSGGVPFGVLPEKVLFGADDGVTGNELHALDVASVGAWRAEPFGRGCGARIGAEGVARVGANLTVTLQGGPRRLAGLILGSRAVFVRLGVDCQQHVAEPVSLETVATDGEGRARMELRFPADPALVGMRFALQWAVEDPAGTVLGGVGLSDGLEVVVGR